MPVGERQVVPQPVRVVRPVLPVGGPAPSSAPRNVEAAIISPTVARLSWDAPLQADQNGIIRQYHINITEVDTARQWTFISITNTYLLNFLRPHHTYLYSIAAVTISTGPYTQLFNFTTPPDSKLVITCVIDIGEWD